MELKPQDVVVMLKLLLPRKSGQWTYATLAAELGMSASQVFRSVQRAEAARLIQPSMPPPPGWNPPAQSRVFQAPNRSNLKEFLVHGVAYAFPAQRGAPTRGIPTADGAPPLNQQLLPPPFPLVWPFPEGQVRGTEFSPLHKNAPQAAMRDQQLYELLALVDAIRDGRAREKEIAVRELTQRIDAI